MGVGMVAFETTGGWWVSGRGSGGRGACGWEGRGGGYLGDAFVEEAELGFKFGELVLEVEQDAMMEVGEFAV